MPTREEELTTSDGLSLFVRRSEIADAKAHVLLVHGFGEHCGRYAKLTDHLTASGYSVTAYDQRGHGRSEGLPGHVDRFADYEDDLERIIKRSGKPLFIVAHSMGGLVTLRYLALRGGAEISGAAISAPLVKVAAPVPAHKLAIARLGAKMAPRLRLDNEIDPAVLSRDPEVGRAYAADPLVNRKVSTRWFTEALLAMQELQTHAGRITVPLLIMHGTEDRLASPEATKQLFEYIGSSDKELQMYEGYYHELFNEPEKDEVFRRVSGWLSQRMP